MNKMIYFSCRDELPLHEPLIIMWHDGTLTWGTISCFDKGSDEQNGYYLSNYGQLCEDDLRNIEAYIILERED